MQDETFSFDLLFDLFPNQFTIYVNNALYTLNKGNYENTIQYYVKREYSGYTTNYFEFISDKYEFQENYNLRMYEILKKKIDEDKFYEELKDFNNLDNIL